MVGKLGVLCGLSTVALLALIVTSGEARDPSPQDAWKAAHVARVVEELASRDVAHLSDAQHGRRLRLIGELRDYGDAGCFAQNEAYPGEAIPHLIDAHGTRCALANLIDRSGSRALLGRLARQHNTSFVPAFGHDPAFCEWLRDSGFTLEEAAYIQGPGFVDSGAGSNVAVPDEAEGSSAPADPSASTGSWGGRTGTGEATWEMWWRLNRHAFVNLRERYQSSVVVTGKDEDAGGRRPSEVQIDETVIPVLRELARDRNNGVRSTALMAWARIARPRHAAEVIEALRDYLGDGDHPYRNLMILALGVVGGTEVLPDLGAILLNKPEGRLLLGQKERLTLAMRAYAAIALGVCGQAGAVEPLMKILGDNSKKMVDLRACAVMSLGVLGRNLEEADRERVVKFLRRVLETGRWGNSALAVIPTAIANMGDAACFLEAFRPNMERFRRPTWVRQASVLGVAVVRPTPDKRLLDMLIATARRDPDNNARRFGIMAIGELAYACPPVPPGSEDEKARAKLGKRIKTYFRSSFQRRSVQKVDLPWLVLSAALFARGFPEHVDFVRKEIVRHATGGGTKERQAAAAVALGLLGSEHALPVLRKEFASARDKLVRGYLAEALGMLGDRTQREGMLERLKKDGDGELRYRAARGLGFSADASMLEPLVETLATTGSADARTALARVVGELGDRRALPLLLDVARKPQAGTGNRVRALGAIGLIGQKSDHAWVTRYQRGVNWPQATGTLRAVFGLF
jgi:HEAT repeat protein